MVRATHVEAPGAGRLRALPGPLRGRGRGARPRSRGGRGARSPSRAGAARSREPSPRPRRSPSSPRWATGARRSPSPTTSTTGCPSGSFLKRSNGAQKVDTKGIERTGAQLVETLSHFNVEARVIGTVTGPHVTRYELRLAPGIKMSKVAQLKDDLAYALAAEQVRILAPIPGKQAVGVEVPNRVRKMVHLGDVFQEAPKGWSPLSVWLGKDIAGKAIGTDLAKQPHILIAGTTGSGQVGLRERDALDVLLRSVPERGAHGAGGPQARGAQPLRGHPAPAHAGRHEPAPGRQRARQPDQGDGGALRRDEPGQDAQPHRAQPRARAPGRARRCPTSSA